MSGNKGMKWGKPKKPDKRSVTIRVTFAQWDKINKISLKNGWTIAKSAESCVTESIGA